MRSSLPSRRKRVNSHGEATMWDADWPCSAPQAPLTQRTFRMREYMKTTGVILSAIALVLAITTGAVAANKWIITKSSQIKPGANGYGNLSATAKQRLAGAKDATGATGGTGATWATGATGAVGPPGTVGAAGLSLFARVDQTGALHQHSAGVTASKNVAFTGIYTVTFTQDISACAVVISQGQASNNSYTPTAQFKATIDSDPGNGGDIHSVDVNTSTDANTAINAGFDLIVAC